MSHNKNNTLVFKQATRFSKSYQCILKRLYLLFAMALFSTVAIANVINELDHDAFKAMADESMVIDVRTPEEYAEGHVPGATNIPLATIEDHLDKLGDKSQPIVVYCRSGYRAGKALEVLANNGYSNLHHLEGDITGWKAAGEIMETPNTSN